MKNSSATLLVLPELNDDDIRAYAHHLYEQSNRAPGHDLDNWLEATACLRANIPTHASGTRLHHHTSGSESSELAQIAASTRK